MPSIPELAQTIAVWALPVLFAITLHEVAHGWAALGFGDNTAQVQGRLSLNPIKHIDPVGTILVPLIFLVMPGGFLFGWAKPVPVVARNFKHPRRDMAFVAAAGPLANAAMALAWGLLLKLASTQDPASGVWIGLSFMAVAGITINLVLMALNLLPLPPLDGGRVLGGLLPAHWAHRLDRIEPYGLVIIVVLLVTGVLGAVLTPFVAIGKTALATVLGLR